MSVIYWANICYGIIKDIGEIMDNKKDIQGQSTERTQGNSAFSPITTGEMNAFGLSLAKKCERIATALYLVTNFLSDTEPLKARLRTLGLELVRDASSVRYGTMLEIQSFNVLHATIAETLSLLELAFIAGLVSEMNFSILRREYLAIRDASEVKKTSRESRTDTILDKIFDAEQEMPTPALENLGLRAGLGGVRYQPAPQKETRIPQGHQFDKGHTNTQMSFNVSKGQSNVVKPPLVADKIKSAIKRFPVSNNRRDLDENLSKDSRRGKILKLIKDSDEVTIKDISLHFPELSEKTIQRELVALIEGGILKKEGERRWSRYFLA